VQVFLQILKNEDKAGLRDGRLARPATIRVYQADSHGGLGCFVGEDHIDHTPKRRKTISPATSANAF